MKKLVLLMAVALVFSCSKDSVDTQTTADLSQNLEQADAIQYYGVFGHSTNRDLHGKFNISIQGEKATATIDMVNGNDINFRGVVNNNDIHFTSDQGSFDFDMSAAKHQEVSNLVVNGEENAYIIANRGVGWVMLGEYYDNADPTIWGWWDMFTDGVTVTLFGADAQYVSDVVVTHLSTFTPITDSAMETPAGNCTLGEGAFMWDPLGTGLDDDRSVFANSQSTMVLGKMVNWGIEYRTDLGACSYVNEACDAFVISGYYTRGSRTGTVYNYACPVPPDAAENTNTTKTTNTSLKLK